MAKKQQVATAKSMICASIKKGWKDERIIKDVLKKSPESKVDSKHCTKYRRLLFNSGEITAELCAKNSREYKEWNEKQSSTKKSAGSKKAKK